MFVSLKINIECKSDVPILFLELYVGIINYLCLANR